MIDSESILRFEYCQIFYTVQYVYTSLSAQHSDLRSGANDYNQKPLLVAPSYRIYSEAT